MSKNNDFDFDTNLDDLEDVNKLSNAFPFPTATFYKYRNAIRIYFNAACLPYMEGWKRVHIKKNAVALLFAPARESTGFTLFNYRRHCGTGLTSVALLNMGLEGKTYRIYRCSSGLAIKRMEPITKEDA